MLFWFDFVPFLTFFRTLLIDFLGSDEAKVLQLVPFPFPVKPT